jgi:hypothetical protein
MSEQHPPYDPNAPVPGRGGAPDEEPDDSDVAADTHPSDSPEVDPKANPEADPLYVPPDEDSR